jgi:cytosine deaminase
MEDIVIQNAKLQNSEREEYDIVISNKQISDKSESGNVVTEANFVYDADGKLVTPTFTEPHCHLGQSLSAGDPGWNDDGSLLSGIKLLSEYKSSASKKKIKQRAHQTINWYVANGVTRIRTHVDVTEPNLTSIKAVLELKRELADTIEIQVVAFPVDGMYTQKENISKITEALKLGADQVGAIPHFEYTNQDGVESVKTAMDIAEKHNVGVDIHIDEIDDTRSRFTEVLAGEACKRDLSQQVTASHSTAMHSYPNSYANKVITRLAEADVNVITNPLDNAVLQGAHDDYPKRRGHTRITELLEAGVTVGIGHDSVMDTIYEYGTGDPIDAAYVLAHYAHMNSRSEAQTIWNMITKFNAKIFGKNPKEYGLTPGCEGSLIVHNATNVHEAIRTRAERELVISRGKIVSETKPKETTVNLKNNPTKIQFDRELN